MERWKQKEFFISTFDPFRHDISVQEAEKRLALTKEANFNLVEFTWRNREEVTVGVEACEAVGMPSIVQDPCFGGIGEMDREATEETVKEALAYYGKYKQIMGYYVWDEPMEATFAACRKLTDVFKSLAPDKLAFSVVLPSYGIYNWNSSNVDWTDNGYVRYVNGYLEVVDPDVFSMDHYVFAVNKDMTDLKHYTLWRDLGFCRKRAIELNKPFWFYYQGVSFAPVDDDCTVGITPGKLAVQMYAALSYGVKQLSCFTSSGLIINENGKTRLFDDVKELNRRVMNVGNELLDKTPLKIYHTGVEEEYIDQYFLDREEDDEVFESADAGLVLGRLEKDGDQYLMVTNQSFSEPTSGKITLKKPERVKVFNEDTAEYADLGTLTDITYDLKPGRGVLYRLCK